MSYLAPMSLPPPWRRLRAVTSPVVAEYIREVVVCWHVSYLTLEVWDKRFSSPRSVLVLSTCAFLDQSLICSEGGCQSGGSWMCWRISLQRRPLWPCYRESQEAGTRGPPPSPRGQPAPAPRSHQTWPGDQPEVITTHRMDWMELWLRQELKERQSNVICPLQIWFEITHNLIVL